MFAGDIYTGTAHSLGYGAGDSCQMGWSSKPRFSASVRVGNWYEDNVPVSPAPAPDMLTTAQESYRSPPTGQVSRPDAAVRTTALLHQTQGKGSAALFGTRSLPTLSSLYSSTHGAAGVAGGLGVQTDRSYDRKSGKWLPEPIDVLASGMQRGYASTSNIKWFRGTEAAGPMQSTMKSTYGAHAAAPVSPEDKRFARSYSFSRHLLTSRSIARS